MLLVLTGYFSYKTILVNQRVAFCKGSKKLEFFF